MNSLYYIGAKPRYIAEDDFPMDDEYEAPFDEPEPCDIAKQEELDDLRLALLEIGYTPALMRRQAS